MKKCYLALVMLLLSVSIFAQELEVTGEITDSQGIPIPGVNIVEQGTTNGTSSDVNGNYSLNVGSESMLKFSSVGYKTVEKSVSGQKVINVEMEAQTFQLAETVITALGISQAKKAVGYSTQEIKPETLEKAKSQNIGSMFSGKIAGLTVINPTGIFQAPDLKLRGKDPLIVVDNVPVTTDMWEINPNDIAEINVLKGTTASALYGSRGRNGAILITTKNATEEGLDIEVSTNTMVTAGYVSFPDVQEEYGNGSQGKYEFWDGAEGGISDGDMIWGPKFSTTDKVPQWNSPLNDKVTGKTIPWWGDVTGTQYDDKSRYSRVPVTWEHHDYLKEFLETGYVTTNNFAVNYKGQNSAHRFSANYSRQKGQVPNTSMQTGGVKLNSTFDLTPSLQLSGKFGYDKVYSPNYPRYGYGPKNHIYTILIWMGWDVDPVDQKNHYWVPGQEGYRQANWNYAWYNNPYFAANKLNQEYDEDILKGNLSATWDITRELSLTGRASAVKKGRFEDRESPKSYLNYGDPRAGDYKTWNRDWLTVDNDIHATYHKPVSSDLNLTVNAGGAAFIHRYENYYAATDGLVVPEVYSLNNTRNNVKAETYLQEKTIRSIYGTFNIDLIDAFFLSVAARNDWSSALPETNDSYFYPSASLSTMVSNLVDLPSVFDYLKLYGSWAEVSADLAPRSSGNPDKVESEMSLASIAGYGNPYQIASYYSNVGAFGGMTMLSYPGGIINPNIKPEKSTSYELGLSTSFMKNKLGIGLTYFNVVDENQILNLPLPSSTGFRSRLVNGNAYTTNGVEFELTARPVQGNDFSWNLAANASHMVKKLTKIYGGEKQYGNYSLNERVDNQYQTVWMKSPDGKVILDESSGMPTKDQFPQNVGHFNPDVWFGLQNTFKINKFTIGMDIDGAIGGVMRSLTVEKMWWGGKHPESTDYRDEQYATSDPVYLPEGVNVVSGELTRDTDGKVISDTRAFKENTTKVDWQTWCQNYPYRARVTEDESEQFANVLDRSFIKLRRLSLSYDMSELVSNVPGIKGLNATLFSYNLFMLKAAKIIDPDFGIDDELQDPAARYIGLNLTLNL